MNINTGKIENTGAEVQFAYRFSPVWSVDANYLTSSLRTPKFFVKEFSYFLMPCHQHGLRINLLVQR